MSVIMITDDTLEKLKCDLCHNYLSYFPICMSNDKNICGRLWLHPQEESELKVIKIFETLAELIEFPCQYEENGCSVKCFPKDIIGHEKTCYFRTVKCPTRHISPCNWEGPLPIVLDHCQNMHNDLILKDGNFELNLAKTYQRENLLQHDSALFLVSQNFTSLNKLMKSSIRYPDYVYDIKDNTWKITFETTNRKLEIRMDTQAFEDNKNTIIYLDNFVGDADSYEISVKGKVMVDKKIENEPAFSEEENDKFLALLKCSLCSNYALPVLPPISQITMLDGQKKGIQCSSCKLNSFNLKHNSYENLNEEFYDDILNTLAQKITFPCKYSINGCTFKSKLSVMENHNWRCSYKEYDCPVSEFVSCNWKGFEFDIPNHIEEIHSDLILKTPTLSIKLRFSQIKKRFVLSKNEITCHIIKFLKSYFCFIFFQDGEEFYWEVNLIGHQDVNFNFEIEIISRENSRSLRIRHPCLMWSRGKEEMLREKKCYFNFLQLADFMYPTFKLRNLGNSRNLNFNVKIFK